MGSRGSAVAATTRCGRPGTAALELVVVLPVLLVIVAGAADLSRAIRYENTLANAARVGAAYGATHSYTSYTRDQWESRVRQAAREEAVNLPGFVSGNLKVEVETSPGQGGRPEVHVEVSYPFDPILGWSGSTNSLTVRRAVTMQAYR